MTRLLSMLRSLGVAHVAGALVVGLIAVDLFAGASGVSPPKAGAGLDAVQNYVLFAIVTDGTVTFTTGTQFASTTDRHIAGQWCYITRSAGNDALDPRVTVANADATGKITPAAVAPEALARFGIDAAALDKLVARHCRFQGGG